MIPRLCRRRSPGPLEAYGGVRGKLACACLVSRARQKKDLREEQGRARVTEYRDIYVAALLSRRHLLLNSGRIAVSGAAWPGVCAERHLGNHPCTCGSGGGKGPTAFLSC